uniref:Uncharacterized protein n=1 Tax=Arundo donax TaxID=35708 RepID=A0A0A9A3H2_ARUDO
MPTREGQFREMGSIVPYKSIILDYSWLHGHHT